MVMKKSFIKLLLPCVALVALLGGCKNEPNRDRVKPRIDLEDPAEGERVAIGDPHGMHLEMKLSDNERLSSYKLEIHPNFDGHTHKIRANEEAKKPFYFSRTYQLDQREANIHQHDVKIPANAQPGNYHLMVYALDKAGNEAMVARNIVLVEGKGDHDHDHAHGHDHDHDHHHD